MNFAFPAILIFILVTPGIVIRYTYLKGFWRTPFSLKPVTEEIAFGLILAGALHYLWVIGPVSFLGYTPEYKALLTLLLGDFGHNKAEFKSVIETVTVNTDLIFYYFSSLYLCAAILGWIGHLIVRGLKWDLSTKFFRYDNDWWYLLRGEVLSFGERKKKRIKLQKGEEFFVEMTTVVNHSDALLGDTLYVYRGFISDFWFDKQGNLDRVSLTEVSRRTLLRDREEGEDYIENVQDDPRFYPIVGHYLVIKYKEMQTINLIVKTIRKREKWKNFRPVSISSLHRVQ